MLREKLRQDVAAVDVHRANPREVVQADLVDEHPFRLDSEQRRNLPLEPIATLQSPTARWPASSSPRTTMPTGFVKSTIQASRRCQLTCALRDLEHDRDGSQRLAEPARAGRLLADAAAGERDRLVREPRRLPSDAQLDQHERRAFEGTSRSSVIEQLAVVVRRGQHAGREAADDLSALSVDVVEDEARADRGVPAPARAPQRARACRWNRPR